MQPFGLAAGTPVYLDMEGYPNSNATCAAAVHTYIAWWTAELHRKGYLSGVYSSESTGIADLVGWYGQQSPDDVWFANWNNQPILTDPVFPTTAYWPNHQRLHQFLGGHDETYNGYTVNVDRDRVGGDVVGDPPRGVQTPPPPPPLPAVTDVFHPLATARVFDTGGAPLVAGMDRDIVLTGLGGLPGSGVDAVSLNVEVADLQLLGRLHPGHPGRLHQPDRRAGVPARPRPSPG